MRNKKTFIEPQCCICMTDVNYELPPNPLSNSFQPLNCFKKHGINSHRICSNCWFNKFAIEGVSHICPGCIKNMPLTIYKNTNTKYNKPIEIIDISD